MTAGWKRAAAVVCAAWAVAVGCGPEEARAPLGDHCCVGGVCD
ncbi:MAG TPA: hypothetical protein RMH99_23885 [Sandaracinaceae bacterium LLY-WYZ-13_1]|nr:hypothetical protein [Sandaracinaceae bacterium LLY-WYZ-13_1]